MLSIGGVSLPSSPPRRLGLVTLATIVIATALTFLTPSAQAAAKVAVTDGTVTWGVKQSWRTYIGESGITVSGGVTRTTDGAFTWPITTGTYDDSTKTLDLTLAGSVRFTAHEDALDMTISSPRLKISGDEPQLFATVVSKDESTGQLVDFGEIPMVNLDLDSGQPTTTGGTTAWTPVDARLTAEMYEAFSRNYGVNSLLDPVSLSYTGPGGKPAVIAENWLSPGSLVHEPSGSTPVLDATAVLPDKDNGVVHVATGTTLRAYDYTTMKPLGDAIPFVGDTYPAPLLDDLSGAVFANNGGQAKAYLWDPTTTTYRVQVLDTAPMTQYSASPLAHTWGFNGTGVYRWIYDLELGTFTKDEYPVTGLPKGRVGFAAFTPESMVFAEAGQKPFSLSIVDGVATRTALPGDYADPDGQLGFNHPTEVQVISSTEYLLSNYRGQLFRIRGASGSFARIGDVVDTGMNGVLRSTIDRTTNTVYLADYAGQTVVAVKGGAHGLITVKDLGVWVLATLPVGADHGELFVGASRTGGSGTDYGIRRFSFAGNSPTVTQQPADALVTLATGQSSDTASFTVDGTLVDSVQWQSRLGSTGRFKDVTGETRKTLTVTATQTDEGRRYRAVVRNKLGATVSGTATLTVHTAPSVVIDPSDIAVTEDGDALFEVMPSGNPYPDITWQRRVGGYWTDIAPSDTNFRIAGGKLTVRSTNLEQDGSLFRAELSNVVETVQSKAARLTVAEPSDATRVISAGTLDWGIKKSFRDYVVGPIAHGAVAVSDGAMKNDDGTFAFTVDSGTWDPKTKRLSVDYDGTVQFTGHDGLLELTVTDPELDATGDSGVLTARVVSKSLEADRPKDFGRIAIADVDTAGAISAAGSALTIKDAPATLTATGAPAFGGFYTTGTALDPIAGTATLGAEVGSGPAAPVAPVAPVKPSTVPPSAGRVTPTLSAKLAKTSITARQRATIKIAVALPASKAGTLPAGQLVIRDGNKIIAVKKLKASHRGRITVTLPRLAKGRHYVKVALNGSPVQLPVTSPYRVLRVR